MDDSMSLHPACNTAQYPSMLITNLMEHGCVDSFSQFEGWLRDMDSRVYLVAVPLDFYGPTWQDKTKYHPYMGEKTGDPENTLWVGVNGLPEAEQLLHRLAITPAENLEMLHRTGVLTLDANEQMY